MINFIYKIITICQYLLKFAYTIIFHLDSYIENYFLEFEFRAFSFYIILPIFSYSFTCYTAIGKKGICSILQILIIIKDV